jgi:hypothetical protein
MYSKINYLFLPVLLVLYILSGCITSDDEKLVAQQWQYISLSFESSVVYSNPYMDVDMHADFVHSGGMTIRRPAFWDGDSIWRIHFTSPLDEGKWSYVTYCTDENNQGLHHKEGSFAAAPYRGSNVLLKNGLLKMSPGNRNIIFANGNPFVIAGDTPWAMPFRGTEETVAIYAADRQKKGFNTALLMSLMS